jgi:2-desacetyl-2-hydroxyethyl bacteriochlorophyllide A dehydrogenase
MKALSVRAPEHAVCCDAPNPAPGHGQVLIRVAAAGLCGTDLHIYRGEYEAAYPVIPGHEFCGTVAERGQGVDDLEIGQRVAVDPNIFCHRCTYCRRQMHNQCENLEAIGVNRDGAFAEFVVAPREVVYPIGDLPFDRAAFVEPLSCVVYGMQRARPRAGDRVLLFGAGPMGCLLTQMLRISGAARVVVVDRVEPRLQLAEKMGATHTVLTEADVMPPGSLDPRLQHLARDGYDFVVDATGVPSVVEHAFAYLGPRSTMFLFGVCPTGAEIRIQPYQVFRNDWHVIGSFATCYTFQEAIRLLDNGIIQVEPLISHRLPLDRGITAFTTIQQDPMRMKVLILP